MSSRRDGLRKQVIEHQRTALGIYEKERGKKNVPGRGKRRGRRGERHGFVPGRERLRVLRPKDF